MNTAGKNIQLGARPANGIPEIAWSITVEKPARELYQLWREPDKLSQIMGDFAEITSVSENRTHWRMRGPFGRTMEWETQVVENRPGEILRWESLEGARLRNEARCAFAPRPEIGERSQCSISALSRLAG